MTEDTQNKIYYDVNIPYRAEAKDYRYHNYSKAETEIRLNGPLIADPCNYDVAISKFKIDTECIPVFIPEMAQPQAADGKETGEMISVSSVTIYFPKMLKPQEQRRQKPNGKWENYTKGAEDRDYEKYDYQWYDRDSQKNNGYFYDAYKEFVTFVPNEGFVDRSWSKFTLKNTLPSVKYTDPSTNNQREYADNTDPAYFQYDYQSVLDRINCAMERALQKTYISNTYHHYYHFDNDDLIRPAFFALEGGLIKFYISYRIIQTNILFKFSPDLYKYIGNGFKCRFYNEPGTIYSDAKADGSFFIDYNPFVWRHHRILKGSGGEVYDETDKDQTKVITDKSLFRNNQFFSSEETYLMTTFDTNVIFNNEKEEKDYKTKKYQVLIQQYSTLANWNVCKALLICSSSFPIKPEYYPTLKKNMFLTHYKEEWYLDVMRRVYNDRADDETQAIFDKSSTKILDVYYPISSAAGDIRSCVIYSNDNIETGNKIDMIGGMDLENFDIKVKWVDIYGNVYDLYLAPGCSVSIRLCFTRKKILKDDIVAGFKRVADSIDTIAQSHTAEENPMDYWTMKKRKKPKVRNEVVPQETDDPYVLPNGLRMKGNN